MSKEELGQISEEPAEVEARSEPLTLENCGSLPLSHNWYWIGLAMGLPSYKLACIEVDGRTPVDCLYKMLEALTQHVVYKYETGHLYNVLLFLDDQAAIQAFPAHLKAEPTQALATLVPSSSMAHALITLAGALSHQPQAFGQQLGLPDCAIASVMAQYQRDPRLIIVKLIQESLSQDIIRRRDLLDRLVTAAISLGSAEMKIRLPEAMDWTIRKTHPLQPQATGFSVLLSEEQKLRQKLRAAALASLDVPPEFICPITLDLVQHPVAVQMGNKKQIFEREALHKWIEETTRNPLTNLKLQWNEVQEFPEIMPEIHQWLENLP